MVMLINTNIFGEMCEVCGGQHKFANREWQEFAHESDVYVLVAA